MKKKAVIVALLAVPVLLSGCALVGGSDELSSECQNTIEEAAREFGEAVRSLEEGITGTGALTSPTFPGLERVGKDCEGENQNEVASEYVVALNNAAKSTDTPLSELLFGTLCQGILDDNNIGLTNEAKQLCDEAVANVDAATKDLQDVISDAQNWVENGELPSGATPNGDSIFGPGGPAIGGVDTDLSFPSSDTSGSSAAETQPTGLSNRVAPYELTYIVDGKGTAILSYIDANDVRQEQEVTLPWQYTATSVWDYNTLDVRQFSFGQVSCAIYHDGQEVDKYTASGEQPTVYCFAQR